MKHNMNILRRIGVWLWRIRHRKGYGIHSPFAFGVVTDVVYNDGEYYAYEPLHRLRCTTGGGWREKDDRLMLRLANHWQPRHVAVVGRDMGTTVSYLQAGRRGVRLTQVGQAGCVPRDADMVVMDSPEGLPQLLAATPAEGRRLVVAAGIHGSGEARRLWREALRKEACTVSFDLYRLGLVYHMPALQRQDYIVNYW